MIHQKINIPSSEIRRPKGYHSDLLGFTFLWNGHFLRGILPEAAEEAKEYFESGFIDEICGKHLFPKTWISNFENEEFAFIIEHEMMTPLMYATDWNFSMLRNAAVLVLEIAKIAKRYGYNMIDCHKLNIMFKYSRPMYVDLGSFIRSKKGTTAWMPYLSFLRSYYYPIDIWKSGAGQIAKRSMTPGVQFNSSDYHLYKNPIWRVFPRLMDIYDSFWGNLHAFAATSYENVAKHTAGHSTIVRKLVFYLKKTVNFIKPVRSQRLFSLNRMQTKLKNMHLIRRTKLTENIPFNTEFISLLNLEITARKAVVFEPSSITLLSSIIDSSPIESIIAVHEDEYKSDAIYQEVQQRGLPVTCTFYQISEGGLLIRGRFPEQRFRSDVVIVTEYVFRSGIAGVQTTLLFVEERLTYSSTNTMVFLIPSTRNDIVAALKQTYSVHDYEMKSCACKCLFIRNKQKEQSI